MPAVPPDDPPSGFGAGTESVMAEFAIGACSSKGNGPANSGHDSTLNRGFYSAWYLSVTGNAR